MGLFRVKGLTGNESMNELAQGEVLLSRLVHYAGRELFIAETEGSTECVFNEGFAEAEREGIRLRRDDIAQSEIVFERGAVVERGRRIDGPGLFHPAFTLVGVFGAPLAGGVEVFQAKADGVDLTMAVRA